MLFITVLKSGGEYTSSHVRWLHNQLPETVEKICMSDIEIEGISTIPLRYGWPGWFSKLEIFNPLATKDDIFYIDLDTVICGDITELLSNNALCALNDFYFPKRASSGLLFIPNDSKKKIWDYIMSLSNFNDFRGDGELLDSRFIFERWQDRFPGKIISYKKNIAKEGMVGYHSRHSVGDGTLPEGASVVCFHGMPRPWQINADWIPKL